MRREAALPQIHELQNEIVNLEKDIAVLRKQEREVENEVATVNKSLAEIGESMENDCLSLTHAKESVRRLDAQVVRNPAELKRVRYSIVACLGVCFISSFLAPCYWLLICTGCP